MKKNGITITLAVLLIIAIVCCIALAMNGGSLLPQPTPEPTATAIPTLEPTIKATSKPTAENPYIGTWTLSKVTRFEGNKEVKVTGEMSTVIGYSKLVIKTNGDVSMELYESILKGKWDFSDVNKPVASVDLPNWESEGEKGVSEDDYSYSFQYLKDEKTVRVSHDPSGMIFYFKK